jgi:hypothetical protein
MNENFEQNLIKCAQRLSDVYYYFSFNKWINWENPVDLNEKINWLSFNTNTETWSALSDKYGVREFIKSKQLEFLLNDIYEKWDNVEDIDLTNLPTSFVIKTNCSSNDTIIVQDKKYVNLFELKKHFKKVLDKRFGIETSEPHYLRIKPCIFAEKLIGSNINDYKVWCFNGKPYCIQVISNRHEKKTMNVFDVNWNEYKDWLNPIFQNENTIEKPKLLTEMLKYAEILSEGFPQVRVDFYIENERLYFSEMTFTASAGRLLSFNNKALLNMGQEIKIKNIDNNKENN